MPVGEYLLIGFILIFGVVRRNIITWNEFDMILQSNGLHLLESEIRLLAKLFDSTGDHGVPYMDFVAWLDMVMDMKSLTKAFPNSSGMFKGQPAKPKVPERKMSTGYMQV